MSIENRVKAAAAIAGISAILIGSPLTAQNPSQPVSLAQQASTTPNINSGQKFIDYVKGLKEKLPEKLSTARWNLSSYFNDSGLGVSFRGDKFSYHVGV